MASSAKDRDSKVAGTTQECSVEVAVGAQDVLHDRRHANYMKPWKWSLFYRSVLVQMILFGMLSLVGPAMDDAITNLGGGGLDEPWLANLANSLSYAMSFFSTIIGGPLINKMGIKWACFVAAMAMPLHGSAYYMDARYSNEVYLLTANVIKGFASGMLYVAETTAMLSYPKLEDRGFYLGIWSAMRNSGSVIGGAINFSTNSEQSSAGGIGWATYLIFIGFECTGVIWALLLSQTQKVRRRDGSKVPMSSMLSWKHEFVALWRYLRQSNAWLFCIPSFYSFFYGGVMGTYLSLHFSVRARAFSSLLIPSMTIPSVILFGRLLDSRRWSQRTKAWTATMLWILPQLAGFIWCAYEYHDLGDESTLDYGVNTRSWIRGYFPYIMVFITGYWTQLTLYWIIGNYSNDVKHSSRSGGVFRAYETAGQAVSYGLSSSTSINAAGPAIPLYINIGLWVCVIPSMYILIKRMPATPVASCESEAPDELNETARP